MRNKKKNRFKKTIFAISLGVLISIISIPVARAAQNDHLTNDTNFIQYNQMSSWYPGTTLSGDTYTINPENGTNGGIKIPYTLFDVNQNYVLTFDIQKTSGDIKTIGGQLNLSNKTTTYIDGKKSGDYNGGTAFPNDSAKHTVKVEFNTNWLESTSWKDVYIQPNRANYAYKYNAKISNIKFTRVPSLMNLNLNGTVDTVNDAIDLKWDKITKGTEPFTYKVFQKRPDASTYQSISTSDLNKKVKVLNVYPDVGGNITYTTWNGTKRTIKKAGSAEQWMEEPNAKNAKGYGAGQIDVDPVTLDAFNSNPNSYLKNGNGTWKYDVVFFGSWDENGGPGQAGDLTAASASAMHPYINSGRGVLVGHDTILGYNKSHANFNSLREYGNILASEDGVTVNNIASSQVSVRKTGLLTSYPWLIGDVGKVLDIPLAHSTNQVAKGDVWFSFHDFTNPKNNSRPDRMGPEKGDKDGNGTNNFYLTTWNNFSMIQTGHSFGEATEDEQKIIANTLFYLAQLTNNTNVKDRSAGDVIGPVFNGSAVSYAGTATSLTMDFPSATDRGSSYDYYVEGNGQNTNQIYHSEVKTVTNTSGLAGYSYVLDNSPTTVPNNVVNLTTPKLTYNSIANKSTYLHVAAVDKKGNISTPIHIKIADTIPPTISVTGNPTAWTKNDVTLTVSGMDATSGVKEIILPNGAVVAKNAGAGQTVSSTYSVNQNGNYTFKTVDYFGNTATQTVNVTFIDKSIPIGTITGNPTSWTNTNPTLTIKASDVGSGVKSIKRPDGTVINSATTSFTPTTNGNYSFEITDNAGNITIASANVTKIDKTLPTLGVTQNPTAWTNGNVTLTATGASTGGSGVKSITLPNGTVTNGSTGSQVVTANGTYTFKVTDNAGNVTSKAISVTNIDKAAPTGTITGNPTLWTNGNAILTIKASDIGSGVKSIKKPDNTVVNSDSTTFTATTNGSYTFMVTDNAGNSTSLVVSVTKIDKSVPAGTISGNPTAWTNGNANLTLNASDVGSGVKSIKKPDGSIVTGTSTTYTATANGTYSFIITDNVGNTTTVSATVTKIDKALPTLTLSQTPTTWTNGSVTLNVTGSDTGGSGIQSILLPNGTSVATTTGSQVVTANGTYTFKITDNAGNITTQSIVVSNIDKVIPTGVITGNPTAWTNANVVLTINASDTGGSGVKSIKKPDNTVVNSALTTFTATANGNYSFIVTDNAGNTKTETVSVTKIDKSLPTLTLSQTPTTWTNGNVTLNATGSDTGGSGVKSITLPNGTIVTGSTGSQVVTANGVYTFKVTDNAGNVTSESITVSNIDKSAPTGVITGNSTVWTNKDVLLTINATDTGGSGIKTIKTPTGALVTGSSTTFTASTNGTYSFVLTDNAGNTTTVSVAVTNIDKILPTIGKAEIKNATQDSFDVYVYDVKDADSGIDKVQFPTWTDAGGQDDLLSSWQTNLKASGANLGNGTWKFTVKRSEHNYEFGYYTIHIYAYDNAGNKVTTTAHYELRDIVKPTIEVTGNPVSWIGESIVLTVKASDAHTGVKSITLPNGTIVVKNGAKGEMVTHTYTITKNGNYTFTVTDMYDNTISQTITVNKIDTTVPDGTISANTTTWTNQDVVLTITATDNASGVKSITLPDGTILNAAKATFKATKNGSYSFVITDNVRNTKIITETVDNIDKVVPSEGTVLIK